MGCLLGFARFLAWAFWRAALSALIAILFARVDAYVEQRFGSTSAGRLYLRRRGGSVRRGTPPNAASAVEAEARVHDRGRD